MALALVGDHLPALHDGHVHAVWKPTGIQGWDWLWIGLGVFMDITKWAQIAANRKGIPGYPQGEPSTAAPVA